MLAPPKQLREGKGKKGGFESGLLGLTQLV
jgi:hypothetical protein